MWEVSIYEITEDLVRDLPYAVLTSRVRSVRSGTGDLWEMKEA